MSAHTKCRRCGKSKGPGRCQPCREEWNKLYVRPKDQNRTADIKEYKRIYYKDYYNKSKNKKKERIETYLF